MTLIHFVDTFIVVLWGGAIGLALQGWGHAIRGWINPLELTIAPRTRLALTDIWVGLCMCITLTELIHFVRPINWQVSLTILGVGWLLRCRQRYPSGMSFSGAYWSLSRGWPSRQQFLFPLGVISVIFIWIAAAMTGADNYDSGLYHFSSIQWLNEHPITFGLVNLHTRLGYNQSFFILVTLFNIYPLYEQAYAATGIFLFVLTFFTCAYFLSNTVPYRWWIWLGLCILLNGFVVQTSSPSPDVAVALFQVVIFVTLVQLKCSGSFVKLPVPSNANQPSAIPLVLLAILCVSAITIKLSMLMFCLGILLVLTREYWIWLKTSPASFTRLFALCAVILSVHSIKGIALSGLPFYPSVIAGAWTLPYTPDRARVVTEANSIYSWARMPGISPEFVLSDWVWLTTWSKALPDRFSVLMALSILVLTANLGIFFLLKRYRLSSRMYALYLPLLLGVIFWFVTAPDIRFLGAIPELSIVLGSWLLLAALMPILKQQLDRSRGIRPIVLGIGIVMLLAIAAYAFKLPTGLGVAKHLYLGEVLYGMGQLGINRDFLLILLAGFGLSSLKMLRWSPLSKFAIFPIIGTIRMFLALLMVALTLNYFANSSGFNLMRLEGWKTIPNLPFEKIHLESGLTVNIPKIDDRCWAIAPPCTTPQQLQPELKLKRIRTPLSVLPEYKLFTLDP